MKKIRLLISVILILIISGAHALAAPRIPVYKVGNVLYFLDKASGTITGFAGEPGNITIPTSLGGYSVVSIGYRAFAGSSTLKSVVIPDGISAVSEESFASCPNLTSVDISPSVTYIGGKAFANCPNLSSVNLRGLPAYIGEDAFDETNFTIGSDAEFVMLGASTLLKYNGAAEYLQLPDGIKSIAANAFAYNNTIKELVLPSSLEKIGDNAFVHCRNLEKITIPKTVSHIGAGAFDDTAWIENYDSDFVTVNGILVHYKGNSPRNSSHIYIPEGITAIGSGAFMANENLRSVYIPDSVIYIDSMAFASCSELRLVYIPRSVEWIDLLSFTGCGKLTIQSPFESYSQSYAAYMGITYSTPVSVSYNGEQLYFHNAAPIIKDGRTYVPLRELMEIMGYTVSWEKKTGNVTSIKGDSTVIITPDGDIFLNGVESELKAAPINMNGSNVVPVRFVSEAVNANVEWNKKTKTVEISYQSED